MKAKDFNFQKELKYSFETGQVTLKNSRVLILDTNAIGLLRYNLIELLGMEATRALFLQLGYINGYSDFMQFKTTHEFDDDNELLTLGPIMHSWEGVVKAVPKEIRIDKNKGEFYFSGVWIGSYEAEQHLIYYKPWSEPVCWSLMGYSSGWSSAFFGSKLIAIESLCIGKGDDHCEWEIQPPEVWDYEKAKPYIEALKEF